MENLIKILLSYFYQAGVTLKDVEVICVDYVNEVITLRVLDTVNVIINIDYTLVDVKNIVGMAMALKNIKEGGAF